MTSSQQDCGHPAIDLTPCSDTEELGRRALILVSDIRESDPQQLLDILAVACGTEPLKSAQLILTLAAMVPDTDHYEAVVARVEGITEAKRWAS